MIAPCTIVRWGGLYVISASPTSQSEDEPRATGSARRFVKEVCEFKVYISVEALLNSVTKVVLVEVHINVSNFPNGGRFDPTVELWTITQPSDLVFLNAMSHPGIYYFITFEHCFFADGHRC